MQIVLNRLSSNFTLFLNFVRPTVVSTRLCSDGKVKQEQSEEQNTKAKKKSTQSGLAFPEDTRNDEKQRALNNLKILKETVNKQTEEIRTDDSPLHSKITSVSAVKSNFSLKNKNRKKKKRCDILELLKDSVTSVAKEFKGDEKNTKSELVNKIQDLFSKSDNLDQGKTAEEKASLQTKAEKVHLSKLNVANTLLNYENVEKSQNDGKLKNLKWSSGENLGIFDADYKPSKENEVKLKIWDELEKEELKFLSSVAPRNYFEELIMWTEEGKLWHFPIDNEQGLTEEGKVDFTEHVFLEEHLDPWCPKVGPLRHFMELVTCGLSKNPYLTVQDKKEHIYWFRDYFENKKKLLLSLGAFEQKSVSEK